MLTCVSLKSLIHSELTFMSGIRKGIQFYSFACEYPTQMMLRCPNIIYGRDCLSPLSLLGSLVKYKLSVCVWVYFWALNFAPLVYTQGMGRHDSRRVPWLVAGHSHIHRGKELFLGLELGLWLNSEAWTSACLLETALSGLGFPSLLTWTPKLPQRHLSAKSWLLNRNMSGASIFCHLADITPYKNIIC